MISITKRNTHTKAYRRIVKELHAAGQKYVSAFRLGLHCGELGETLPNPYGTEKCRRLFAEGVKEGERRKADKETPMTDYAIYNALPADERDRLGFAKWKEESQVTTHSHGCWMMGVAHYQCALREIERLCAELANALALWDIAHNERSEAMTRLAELEARMALPDAEPVDWKYRTNNAHTHFSEVMPPDDAYDAGTLVALVAVTPQPAIAPPPTVTEATELLVSALRDSKGWMRDYARSLIQDAIDRVDTQSVIAPEPVKLTDDERDDATLAALSALALLNAFRSEQVPENAQQVVRQLMGLGLIETLTNEEGIAATMRVLERAIHAKQGGKP